MKIPEYKIATPKTNFTVTDQFVNNSKTLLPNVLFNKIEEFANSTIHEHFNEVYTNAEFYKLQMLKNAFLNDTINVSGQIKQLNKTDLHFQVYAATNTTSNTICKVVFKFKLKNKTSKIS
ncbi:hypothetical protein R3X25_12735 [Lutibacter sp. TH_r2]|uniref:hypothetical protein n=1 Tax=Lutibacter sp. TH_r2 TaxID=3082083 RepID=UPI002953A9D2|nr:hypothetical protein [Lutibacter sp. TH_r2]MDV7188151.1 hypothetical protein [Lutibacter sp. TH_r2]